MKLAFSTLGCPGWTWEEIYVTAKDLGLDGIEIRGIEAEIYAPDIKPFRPENIDKTISKLKRLNLEIPMLTSASCMFDVINQKEAISEAEAYIDLAHKIGTPFIRVLGDKNGAPGKKINYEHVKNTYRVICEYASGKGVMPLIETNGVFADSKLMARFIKEVGHPNAGILWDIHHPYRYFGESPETTISYLDGHIKYLHIKDSVMKDGLTEYRMLGYGDVPVLDCLKHLKNTNFKGYVSLEWLKRWNPDLEEPGVVFSHYVNYMKYLLEQI
jgi:sugar phosphate isomerase/epimerase